MKFKSILLAVVFGLICFAIGRTQGTGPVEMVSLGGAAGPGSCGPVAAAGNGEMCLASNGLFVSFNGGAWTQVSAGAVTTGVTSWNGMTGAVTYTPPTAPVTSVNGKTGAVIISASTTSNTTLQ